MKVLCSGSEPKPNCGGAALALDDALYIFGGTTVRECSQASFGSPVQWGTWRAGVGTRRPA